MNNTPYHIGDASLEHAIITNAFGYDVVMIRPVLVEMPDLPDDHKISSEEWQTIINAIDAAVKKIPPDPEPETMDEDEDGVGWQNDREH